MNKDERNHYKKLHEIGCIVCLREGLGYSEPHIHHLRLNTGMGLKSSYKQAIGLCPEHHLGQYGFHSGKKTFEEKYGTQQELLEAVLELLED